MADNTEKTCKWLETALNMEKKGKAFYDKAAAGCKNRPCKDIFAMLAGQEVVHSENIKKIYDSLSGGQGWCEWDQEEHEDPVLAFAKMAEEQGANIKSDATDIQALDTGINMELESIKFYRERLEQAENGLEKEFLQQLVFEEKDHHRALTDMKLYLEDPAAWFDEKERGHRDGG